MDELPPRPRIRRRRIVERPRLISAIDRSRARVRSLVAGPGYGKTVLLEQWAPLPGRRIGWYRARRSATDVSVVARALVEAAAPIVPGVGRRMLERLSVTDDPEREAILLGEMLALDLAEWPQDAWLIIDDYHHLSAAEGPERFVETIVARSPVQIVLASRVRPLWVDGKALLYGDVLEITQSMLALTLDEAEQILEGGRLDLTTGLLTLAEGWPAVIGLAGMAPDVSEITADLADDVDDLPEALYAFFSEEVLRGLDPELADSLGVLATMPSVDRELAEILLGGEVATRVCDEALNLGILDERDRRLEFHPLAAAFHAEKDPSIPRSDVLDRAAFNEYARRRDWDAAYEILGVRGLDGGFRSLITSAVAELAETGRVNEVDGWLAFARRTGIESPMTRLAEAENGLRHGRHLTALMTARSLASSDPFDGPTTYRMFLAGARAAHVGSLEHEALTFYDRAKGYAPDVLTEREALWGRAMCLAALELPEAHEVLEQLVSTPVESSPRDLVRAVDKQFSVGFRFGLVHDVGDGRRVLELVEGIDDPLVRCSFRSMFAWALVLAGFYEEAQVQATLLVDESREYRLDPAMPYGYSTLAAALAGRREYAAAIDAISTGASHARRINDENGVQNAYAIRTRILVQQGKVTDACSQEPPNLLRALPSMRGEVLASRALAFASLGRLPDASRLAEEALTATSGVEATQLANCVKALVDLKGRTDSLARSCTYAIAEAFRTGAVDPLVSAYRANPELLSALTALPDARESVIFLVRRVQDEALCEAIGAGLDRLLDPRSALSKREREVYDLVCEGLNNQEIARLLFISESTVKVHVHHVFDKLGMRSRSALVMNELHGSRGADGASLESDEDVRS